MIPLDSFLTDVDGQPIGLGRVATCLVFTTVDCPISNAYQPLLGRIEKEFRSKKVVFVQVHVDPSVTVSQIHQHAKDYKVKWRLTADPGFDLVKRFGATVTPEAVVLDRDGVVRYQGRIDDNFADLGKRRASATTHELRDAIKALVLGKSPAVDRTKAVGCLIPTVQAIAGWTMHPGSLVASTVQ